MANRSSGWSERASGVFSGLRDRLSGNREGDGDGYDDYADYDDYNYDDGYNNSYDDYGEYAYDDAADNDYDSSAVGPVTTRAAGTSGRYSGGSNSRSYGSDRYASGGYASSGSSYRSSSYASGGYPSSNPHLVSMDDARSSVTTRSTDAGTRSSYRSTATSGYDSRYSASTTSTGTAATASSSAAAPRTPVYQIPLTKAAGARNLEILRPREYGDVADMAGTLRKGDAVVLTLKMAPAAISTRVLDFAFGVASALDANVECIGDKVFFVVRGEGISEGEREKLRLQGVVR